MIVRPGSEQHHGARDAGTSTHPLDSGDLLRLGRTEMRMFIAPVETLHAPTRVEPVTASRDDASAKPRVDTRRREVTR